MPEISLNTEIGFEEDLMRRVIAGTMDLALMYSPRQAAGIEVEYLFDETLILVGPDPERRTLDDSDVYVDWGPTCFAQHRQAYPELERPAQTANIGWPGLQLILANGGTCFVPERVAASYLEGGCLERIIDSPSLRLPTYVVYPTARASSVVDAALDELRALIVADQA
jgi:DNA-binding transcriptional LysR family regulator